MLIKHAAINHYNAQALIIDRQESIQFVIPQRDFARHGNGTDFQAVLTRLRWLVRDLNIDFFHRASRGHNFRWRHNLFAAIRIDHDQFDTNVFAFVATRDDGRFCCQLVLHIDDMLFREVGNRHIPALIGSRRTAKWNANQWRFHIDQRRRSLRNLNGRIQNRRDTIGHQNHSDQPLTTCLQGAIEER